MTNLRRCCLNEVQKAAAEDRRSGREECGSGSAHSSPAAEIHELTTRQLATRRATAYATTKWQIEALNQATQVALRKLRRKMSLSRSAEVITRPRAGIGGLTTVEWRALALAAQLLAQRSVALRTAANVRDPRARIGVVAAASCCAR